MKARTILLVLAIVSAPALALADTIVIVHSDSKIPGVTAADLENIYFGKKTLWDDGTRILPALASEDQPEGAQFIEGVLGKTVAQYRSYWKRKLFSGGGTVPKTFKSQAEIVDFVGKNPGAIAVVTSKPADKSVKAVSLK